MSVLDNIPIVDLGLASAEAIDAVQQDWLKAELEAQEEQAVLMEQLIEEAKKAGKVCCSE